MTVIFSNALDIDCARLPLIWEHIKVDRLVEIVPKGMDKSEQIDEAIRTETDTLIFAGHGNTDGLWDPERRSLIFHDLYIPYIKAEKVICVWCHSAAFCAFNEKLNWFSVGMLISNTEEAKEYRINATDIEVSDANISFFNDLNDLIINNIEISECKEYMKHHVNKNNPVDVFNRKQISV